MYLLGRFVEKSGCISYVKSHSSMLVGKSDCVFSEMIFEEIYSLIQINPIQKKWIRGMTRQPPKITPIAIKGLFCQSKIG